MKDRSVGLPRSWNSEQDEQRKWRKQIFRGMRNFPRAVGCESPKDSLRIKHNIPIAAPWSRRGHAVMTASTAPSMNNAVINSGKLSRALLKTFGQLLQSYDESTQGRIMGVWASDPD